MTSTPRQRYVGDYVVVKRIGVGSFADVYKGYHKASHLPVAIKQVSRQKMGLHRKYQENLDQEIEIMKTLQHPNIVQLYDVVKTERNIYLVMEYCAGGDLLKFIRKRGAQSEEITKHLAKQLVAGLKYLRERNLVHRDLKPQNLMLLNKAEHTKLTDIVLKIGDFGFAKHVQVHDMAATLCGSPLYMAPEILRHHKYGPEVDLWSVGTILYEMVYNKPPYTAANHVALLERIERDEIKFPKDVPISADLQQLLVGLLKRQPQQRMTFDEFFNHRFWRCAETSVQQNQVRVTVTLPSQHPEVQCTTISSQTKIPEPEEVRCTKTSQTKRSSTITSSPKVGQSDVGRNANSQVDVEMDAKPVSETHSSKCALHAGDGEHEYVVVVPSCVLSVQRNLEVTVRKPNIPDAANAFKHFHQMAKRALLVTKCGDAKQTDSGLYSSCHAAAIHDTIAPPLVLYVKALQLMSATTTAITEFKQVHVGMLNGRSSTPSTSVSYSDGLCTKLDILTKRIAVVFQSYMTKAQQLRERLSPSAVTVKLSSSCGSLSKSKSTSITFMSENIQRQTETDCAEHLLHSWAVELVHLGALHEMQHCVADAVRKYHTAYRVFEQLSLERNIGAHDKSTLQQLMTNVSNRVKTIRRVM